MLAASAVDLTDLTAEDAPAMAATTPGGAARGGDVIDLLDSESDSEPSPLRSQRGGRKRSAPVGSAARPHQAPKKTRGVIDLSGDRMKVTVELGAGAAAAPRPLPASLSGGMSQTGASQHEGAQDDLWKCSICLDEMVNPASTTCGHLFCEGCIKQCLKTAKKCPQCRKRLTAKNAYHRIYLPSRRPDGGGPPDDAFPAR